MRLEGKRALVTGGGSGIGRAACLRFAAEGAAVAVLDRDEAAAGRARDTILSAEGTTVAIGADVTREEQVADAVAAAVEAFGGLDVVVANAAVQLFGEDDRADRLELDVWRRTLDVNATGAFLTCKHGLRALLESGGGSLICTSSPTGLYALAPGFDAYSASKAAVHGLVRVLALDYAQDGIRVNAVVPGFTDTPLVTTTMQDAGARADIVGKVPLGRPGTAEEVAAMMVFLASDESSYCTGGAFFVDGGLTAV